MPPGAGMNKQKWQIQWEAVVSPDGEGGREGGGASWLLCVLSALRFLVPASGGRGQSEASVWGHCVVTEEKPGPSRLPQNPVHFLCQIYHLPRKAQKPADEILIKFG